MPQHKRLTAQEVLTPRTPQDHSLGSQCSLNPLNRCLIKLCLITVCCLSAFTLTSCRQPQLDEVSLTELSLDEVKPSGARLMRLKMGLHLISAPAETNTSARPRIVLVHGYGSRGYEWIYPAHKLSARGEVYFYRWDWGQCPDSAGAELLTTLERFAEREPKRPIELYGHSYGGVISAVVAARYRGATPITAHLIAAPLAGHPKLEARCSAPINELTTSLQRSSATMSSLVKLRQWRTQHKLDGAFKTLSVDPQIVDWRGVVTTLPDRYGEHRLGHNRSISWVVDNLSRPSLRPDSTRSPPISTPTSTSQPKERP